MIAILLTAFQTPDLVLSRGAMLTGPYAGVQDRYWDVTEAEVDAMGPDGSISNQFALTGGAQRKVLIRFGSLDLAAIRNSKIVDGTLVLSLVDQTKASLKSVKVVKRPWLSPGVSILARKVQPVETKQKPTKGKDAKPELPFAPGVTWNKAGGDIVNWQGAGLTGSGDTESIDAKITVDGANIRVSNLGPTLQYWKTHEGENYGFVLEFTDETGIWNSISPEARPRLELKLENTEVKDPHLTVAHDGDSVTLNSSEAIRDIDVYKGVKKVGTEKGPKITVSSDNPSKDPRGAYTRLVVNFQDSNVPQEVVTIDPTASWAALSPKMTRIWNQWYVDQSFYSFAKYGAGKHLNGEGDKEGSIPPIAELQPLASGSKTMDTMLLPGLVLPPRMTRNPLFRQMAIVDGGPLSMAQVDYLVHGKLQYPLVVLAKMVNYDGQLIDGATATIKTATDPNPVPLPIDKSGIAILPKFAPDASGDVTFTVSANGRTDSLTVPMTTFSDLYARGNKSAISLDLPFNLPIWPVSDDTNLAAGKPVKDSTNSFPAQLVGLVDDNPDTTYTLPAQGWVEVDLGRDRSIGELVLQGEVPKKFKVVIYGTTDKLDQADWWIDEIDSDKFRQQYGIEGDLAYRPTPNTARYIRIENLTDTPAKLKGLKLFAAKKP